MAGGLGRVQRHFLVIAPVDVGGFKGSLQRWMIFRRCVVLVLRRSRVAVWRLVAEGVSVQEAAGRVGVSVGFVRSVMYQCGGVIPQHLLREPSGRYLNDLDRVVIMVGLKQKMSMRQIAKLIGKSPGTVSREVRRNRKPRKSYDARVAQIKAERRAARPKPSKLATDSRLRTCVQFGLSKKWSPEQISHRLVEKFPNTERMRVSHETIYQAIYVQAKGSLRREVEAKLRTGRTLRKPRRQKAADGRSTRRIPGMVMISDRPAEVDDRAVPGHWEGDLIIGADNKSQIGTLVERTTRYCMLVGLPQSRDAAIVADALIDTIKTLPAHLARSLTWDQGIEMAAHAKVRIATGTEIYFCDPHSPWQRGTNENTNGLLRQYFPKSTDLSQHTAEDLTFVATELNGRPRKSLGWKTPAEALNELLLTSQKQTGVATTT